MIWTVLDEDTLGQCRHAIQNCAHYNITPSRWFPLLIRMYEELERAGMLERIEVEQEFCKGCIFLQKERCKFHFEMAHVEQTTGRVCFCPKKTTQDMQDRRPEQQKRSRA